MDKENGDRDKSSAPSDGNPLMDPLNVFAGHNIFGGGMPGSYGHHLTSAYNALLGAGRGGQFPHPPTTSSYGSLGTLSVAASQAASLGINPASAAWYAMASHLAAQDYLARLQAAGMPFSGMPPDMPGFPLMSPHAQVSGSGKQSGSSHSKALAHGPSSSSASGMPSMHKEDSLGKQTTGKSHSRSLSSASASVLPSLLNLPTSREGSDGSGVLGGVRLPPDTEIIKYTSSIVGPKVPGTTNRGRKKTISLDPPSVSVTPTHSNSASTPALPAERPKKNKHPVESAPSSQAPLALDQIDRESDIMKLNGVSPVPAGYNTPPDNDAPLNLSLKPSVSPQQPNNALQSLSSLSQSLGQMPDRISRRKPGPKPRRVSQSPLPPPGPAPSASLAQLFAAADSPRPTEDSDLTASQHKDGRPRNLGRGVSKPKKNTVASLLAQSRALGIKPGLDLNSPLNHQVSLLKANLLQQQLQASASASEGEMETDDKNRTSSPSSVPEDLEKKIQTNTRDGRLGETFSETSSMPDVSTDTSDSDSEIDWRTGKKREADPRQDERPSKRLKLLPQPVTRIPSEFKLPLLNGWKRETTIKGIKKLHHFKAEVVYVTPCGQRLKNYIELCEHLEKTNNYDITPENINFDPTMMLGEYFHTIQSQEPKPITLKEVKDTMNELRSYAEAMNLGYPIVNYPETKLAILVTGIDPKQIAKEEAARTKELTRFIREQEKSEKQEAIRKEREQRNIAMLEARRKRQEEASKLKQEEQHRKQQEREIKRQQTALIKEQIYIQELSKQRELLYTVELERERRRQHMALVKQLEQRKRQEEREKKRLEQKAEKMASREKRMEQRKIEMDLLSEIRKPVEDMELPDLKPLPELNRIPGLRLSGQAFSDTLMVFEFLHNFGETLGFDMGSLPTLNSLQNALLGDEEAEEELLSVMTHLIICAIEDPGIPNPARHTTLLGQSLKQADITHSNISEILRIYLYANATGEVKALTGVQFEREREKRLSDHHNNMNETAEDESGKNAAFFVALRENPTWKMSEMLKHKPFLALNATHKAKILSFLCHELLTNKAVIRQIDGAIENVAQLKRDRWTIDSKLRKLRHLHNRKIRQMTIGMVGGKITLEGDGEKLIMTDDFDFRPPPKDHDDEEEVEGESGNDSDGTQPEEEEDKKMTIEEIQRKSEKLNRQAEENMSALYEAGGQLRAVCYGQDRYFRRYWSLPTSGGLFVEGMESAEPQLFEELLQDDTDSLETPDIKGEYDAEALQSKPLDEDDEMPHLTPEVDTETLLTKYKQENMDDEPAELPMIKQEKEEVDKNGSIEDMETEVNQFIDTKIDIEETKIEIDETQFKTEGSGGEEDSETKSVTDEKKMQPFLFGDKASEDSVITNGQTEAEPAWFSVLPREPCDATSVTSTTSAFRCGVENSELRIPVFPPPPASPSPSQCDSPSPAPLALTPEEQQQLQHCKIHGLPRPAPAKPIPHELRCGWWRITETAVVQQLVENLHTRGAREKELRRSITRPALDQHAQVWNSILKSCVRPGSSATVLTVSEEEGASGLPAQVPPRDNPEDWNFAVALRVDMAVLEQVETMEDKVANASMQVKGWKVPPRASTEEGRQFKPSSSHPSPNLNPIAVAKARLMDLECAIERRYLKPPLGTNVSAVDVGGGSSSSCEPDTIPKGLTIWREAVAKCQTAAQLSMAVHMLEASIAWDKSIMKANCQFCHSGDNEDKLLLCDGCDKGYHTYCFKPKMENIPDGDWFCYECMNKATGDKCCIVCGNKIGRNLVTCDNCPKAYHTDCLQPPISKVPRGKWHCPTCLAKLPRKRLTAKRCVGGPSISPSSSVSRLLPPEDVVPHTPVNEPILSPVTQEEASPESPPALQPVSKKEKVSGKKMLKEMAPCKQLLDDLEAHDEAWPFLLPVNTKQFPTYKKIIKNPMDFSTIRKRLMDSGYKSREEFCSDVRLIFNNCETFNEDDSPVGKAGHNMRLFFETRWTELTNQKPSP
ncbi:bromodomain adjacent to zinc finger domain protein 2B isoform X2 [Macrosteles quadrilineatus]|uniref:bromodomain adjacent to zinc finger domain protein 2B isoform X2 n=1 Tax=Macrosteles quadrilineatus TaxID=74068 RepID=UPI0023E114D3|nr:bromodomain adjacent to zinc finger domain protein 2B isoform X2 [Macrosteles quadrilineatus]